MVRTYKKSKDGTLVGYYAQIPRTRRMDVILLSMGDVLVAVGTNGAIILTNAAYARMFSKADMLIIAEDEEGQVLPPEKQLGHLAMSGTAFRLQFTVSAKDSTRQWFEAAGEPVRSGGIEHGGVITIRDLTTYLITPHGKAVFSHLLL